MKPRDLIERLANVAIIIAAAVFVVVQGRNFFASGTAAPGTPPAPYAVGGEAPVLEGVNYGQSSRTVVVFVNSGCHYCTASMPFYKTLIEQHKKAAARGVSLVAVSRDTMPDLE